MLWVVGVAYFIKARGTRLVVVVLRWAWWSYTTVGTATVAGETCVSKKFKNVP